MNKLRILSLMAFISLMGLQLSAQNSNTNQYLFGSKGMSDVNISGFGSPLINLTTINNELGVMIGGGGALSINQRFFIGAYSESLFSDHRQTLQRYIPNQGNVVFDDLKVGFTHIGIWTGIFIHPQNKIHFGLSTKLGWGALSLNNSAFKSSQHSKFAHNRIFVALPQLEVNLSFTNWLKLNLGIGYQFVSGIKDSYSVLENGQAVEKKAFDSSHYQGLQGNISFLFGFFD